MKLNEDKAITFGDLDFAKKTDTRDMMHGRGTGHFGTGFYFVSKNGPYGIDENGKLKYDYNPARPVYEIDLDSYKLYRPRNNEVAYELHDAFKVINSYNNSLKPWLNKNINTNKLKDELYKIGWDADLSESIENNLDEIDDIMDSSILDYYDDAELLTDEQKDKIYEDNYKELIKEFIEKYKLESFIDTGYNDLETWLKSSTPGRLEHELEIAIDRLDRDISYIRNAVERAANILSIDKNKLLQFLDMAYNFKSNETISTLIMKALGYEGIDVTHLNKDAQGLMGLDNFSYGTVIYDLKPNTFRKIMEPRNTKVNRKDLKEFLETVIVDDDSRYAAYATDSVYQLKNLLVRGDKAYRIYNDDETYYFQDAAGNQTHYDILIAALNYGWLANSKLNLDGDDVCPEDYDEGYMVFIPFNYNKELVYHTRLGEDNYYDCRVYDFGIMFVRSSEAYKNGLFKALGEPNKEIFYNYDDETVTIDSGNLSKTFDMEKDLGWDPNTAIGIDIEEDERDNSKNESLVKLEESDDKDTFIFKGKKAWSGAVNTLDGTIEEVHTYKQAKSANFHHSFYFSDEQLDKMESGESCFFCVYENGELQISKFKDIVGNNKFKFDKELFNQLESLQESIQETDNEGNVLSKEQIEFFKNSKVRDSQGRLIVCGHYSDNQDFDEFNADLVGKNFKGSQFGKGFYFTYNANDYSWNHVFKLNNLEVSKRLFYLNIKQPYNTSNDEDNMKLKDILLKELQKYDFKTKEVCVRMLNKFDNDIPFMVIDDINASTDASLNSTEILKNLGYDGIIQYASKNSSKILQVIAFESNQIKSITNKTPTNSTNINESSQKVLRFNQNEVNKLINSLKDTYKNIGLKVLPIDKLVKDNDLLNDDDLESYHKAIWNNKSAKDFHIDNTQIQDTRAFQIPFVIQKKDGTLKLSDGRHRTRAAYNDGYEYVEYPVYIEENLEKDLQKTDINLTEMKGKSNITDERILNIINRCIDNMKNIHYGFPDEDMLTFNDIDFEEGNSVRTFGTMYLPHNGIGNFKLVLNKHMFNEPDKAIENTIYHELCHYATDKLAIDLGILYNKNGNWYLSKKYPYAKDYDGHGKMWKFVADVVGKKVGHDITRTNTFDLHTGVGAHANDSYKYILKCKHCGREFKYTRMTNFVKDVLSHDGYAESYWCCCDDGYKGQDFEIVKGN